jgi:hypothetical protein
VQKRYRILEIHEVYEYKVPGTTPKLRRVVCLMAIYTFLKLKGEASGYPAWVRTPADEELYIESFWKSEGIRLDREAIKPNAVTAVWPNSALILCGGI